MDNSKSELSRSTRRPPSCLSTTFSGVDPFPSLTSTHQLINTGKLDASMSSTLTTSSPGKKRPAPMTNCSEFGGTDPFPSISPQVTANAAQLMAMTVSLDNNLAADFGGDKDEKQTMMSSRGGNGQRPSLTLELDSNAGVDPIPLAEARRVPGVMTDPFEDDFDPDDITADQFTDFDEEDAATLAKLADLSVADANAPPASA